MSVDLFDSPRFQPEVKVARLDPINKRHEGAVVVH